MKVSAILLAGAVVVTLGACSSQDDAKNDPATTPAPAPTGGMPNGGVTTPDPTTAPATVPPDSEVAGTPQTPPTLPEEPGTTPEDPATQPPV